MVMHDDSEKKKTSIDSSKEEEDMAIVEKPKDNVKLVKVTPLILEQASLLPVRDGVIILDPNNPLHREWMED